MKLCRIEKQKGIEGFNVDPPEYSHPLRSRVRSLHHHKSSVFHCSLSYYKRLSTLQLIAACLQAFNQKETGLQASHRPVSLGKYRGEEGLQRSNLQIKNCTQFWPLGMMEPACGSGGIAPNLSREDEKFFDSLMAVGCSPLAVAVEQFPSFLFFSFFVYLFLHSWIM